MFICDMVRRCPGTLTTGWTAYSRSDNHCRT